MISTFQNWIGAGKELINWCLEKLPSSPTNLLEGRFWFNTTTKKPQYYNGTEVKDFGVSDHEQLSNLYGGEPTYHGHTTSIQNTRLNNSGSANGFLVLDSSGYVPIDKIPVSLLGALRYQTTWDASTNTPTLPTLPDQTTKGYYWKVSVAGTYSGHTYSVGDFIISNGTSWDWCDNVDSITSVFGRTGAVVATSGDYNAAQITNTPSGNISSKTVQAALNQLDTEKATKGQLTDGSVTKVGTATVGSAVKPVYLSAGVPTALSGTVGSSTQPVYLNAGTVTAITDSIANSITGNAATATKLATSRTITIDGDVDATAVSFDGSANITLTTTLDATGVTAGTYPKVTVDAKGRVTSGTSLSASDIPTIAQSQVTNLSTDLANKTARNSGETDWVSFYNGTETLYYFDGIANVQMPMSSSLAPACVARFEIISSEAATAADQWRCVVEIRCKNQYGTASWYTQIIEGDPTSYANMLWRRDQNAEYMWFTIVPTFLPWCRLSIRCLGVWGGGCIINMESTANNAHTIYSSYCERWKSYNPYFRENSGYYAGLELQNAVKNNYVGLSCPGQQRLTFMSSTYENYSGLYNETEGKWLVGRHGSRNTLFTGYTPPASSDNDDLATTAWVKEVAPQLGSGFSAGTTMIFRAYNSTHDSNTLYFEY